MGLAFPTSNEWTPAESVLEGDREHSVAADHSQQTDRPKPHLDEKLHQVTNDHTLAQALVDAGLVDPDDTATHAMRHVLTAALGSTAERADPQVQRLHLSSNDQVLLCTDGLSEMVSKETITDVLKKEVSSKTACQSLIDLALASGGTDNITVVLARYQFPYSTGLR